MFSRFQRNLLRDSIRIGLALLLALGILITFVVFSPLTQAKVTSNRLDKAALHPAASGKVCYKVEDTGGNWTGDICNGKLVQPGDPIAVPSPSMAGLAVWLEDVSGHICYTAYYNGMPQPQQCDSAILGDGLHPFKSLKFVPSGVHVCYLVVDSTFKPIEGCDNQGVPVGNDLKLIQIYLK